ncbi:hypothetical protein BX616_011108 [Lobosporangium transversale]|uniref:PHD-type domain-containing protein n=1 Tax=Lobosporangium transversale TaxID=64571 RepID=A0A1Y2GF42_9FUNG|nr:hypothetical protein BCR41DRAFT_424248 [Lobosporangium transversale]KAF9909659.1 hypothetical protein BX616_011108 [Lobosporangium transversale]ORZ09047.1 hypothetical protein BCR41DRAFT_424248 [Lobosporangium transversale]|eukprot:XP_021878674.1 hypothetical protein BCR41DRAFT_424248 [Lobosporangium transversale]
MSGSDSGSSDLSEASSLSSDNSSGSEADVPWGKKPQSVATGTRPSPLNYHKRSQQNKNQSQIPSSSLSPRLPLPRSITRPTAHDTYASLPSSSSPFGTSESENASDSDEDSTDQDQAAVHIQKKGAKGTGTAAMDAKAPISLSASQPVYSKEIMEGTILLSPTNTKHSNHYSSSLASSRERGRGRGRAPLTGHGARKYDPAGATVIDFDDPSSVSLSDGASAVTHTHAQTLATTSPLANNTITSTSSMSNIPSNDPAVRKKKSKDTTAADRSKSKTSMTTNGTKKSGRRKVGRPKTVSKDVYCICREPYDGVEFMVACDRCEEWFHGRCIGMRPQDVKKSTHYYCDTCQRIRRMFGVTNVTGEPAKSTKSKTASKKDTEKEKRSRKQDVYETSSASNIHHQTLSPLKIKTKSTSNVISSQNTTMTNNSAQAINKSAMTLPFQQQAPQGLTYARSLPSNTNYFHSPKGPNQRPNVVQQNTHMTHYNTLTVRLSHTQPSYNTINSLERISQDDEDEDVCPVCDFECTCNNGNSGPVDRTLLAPSLPRPPPEPALVSTTMMEGPHSVTAIKVPFQPNIVLRTGSSTHAQSDHLNEEHRSSFMNAEKRPVIKMGNQHPDVDIDIDVDVTSDEESFRTSAKNPMSATSIPPFAKRRLSVTRRGGKGVGKSSYPMHAARDQYTSHNRRGKGLKGGKSADVMHLYYQTMSGSDSDISGEYNEAEDSKHFHVPTDRNIIRVRARYESDDDDSVDQGEEDEESMDEVLSLSSVNSLTDFDENDATQAVIVPKKMAGRFIEGQASRMSFPQPAYSKMDTDEGHTSGTSERTVMVSKRGPGRPRKRKNKDPLIVSREDEMTLYTPAVASRKPKIGSNKPTRASNKYMARTDQTSSVSHDPNVNQDGVVLDALENDNAGDEQQIPTTAATAVRSEALSESFSESDLFGDSDLSDELSGDLSDIMSDDFDDLSEDGLDFNSSDEDDDASSTSSPREFNYSDMEEQDESLVDSDSSINSVVTDSSDSSDVSTDSENVGDTSDSEDEVIEFDQNGSQEPIDEEELMLLAEQERIYLAKAYGLLDILSDEDSDPDRNPFESSEDDNNEDDERDFIDEDEYYSDDYEEDDYYEEDEYNEIDEQEILARLKGIQSDIQTLMTIPAEQQEQLLLLQHYGETHRQQQEQLQLQQQGLPSQSHQQEKEKEQEQDQPYQLQQQNQLQASTIDQPNIDTQIPDLLTGAELLPTFDMSSVPDLDAVSEQLAASLANSIAMSMAAKKNGSLFSDPVPDDGDEDMIAQRTTAIVTADMENTLPGPNVSPISAFSPESSGDTAWASAATTAVAPSLPSSLSPSSSSLASIHTIANTPTPARITTTEATLSPLLHTETETHKNSHVDSSVGSSTSTLSPSALFDSNFKAQEPLSNVNGQPIQSVLSETTYRVVTDLELSMLNHQSKDQIGKGFEKDARKALITPITKNVHEEDDFGLVRSETNPLDTMSVDTPNNDPRKRKDDGVKIKEETPYQAKRRRLSTISSKSNSAMDEKDSISIPGSELSLHSSSISVSSPSESIPVPSLLEPLPSFGTHAFNNHTTPSLIARSISELAPAVVAISTVAYEFSKAAMPFIDLSDKIPMPSTTLPKPGVNPNPYQQQQQGSSVRTRKYSISKSKEAKPSTVEVIPMDDLLDTSALYDRSSSRSPSPEHTGGTMDESGADKETEREKALLKDLHRWERVPIGMFRRSRLPSLPHVGLQLQGALKSGNATTMPATLLADHQQHQQQQQQFYQEPHCLQRRVTGGLRKHRSSSASSDVTRFMQSMQTMQTKSRIHRTVGSSSPSSSLAQVGRMAQDSLRVGVRRRRARSSHGSDHIPRSNPHSLGVDHISKLAGSRMNFDSLHGVVVTAATGNGPKNRRRGADTDADAGTGAGVDTDALQNLMTDVSQPPSSACPTPMHSPLFSAATASERIDHHSSGEPIIAKNGVVDGGASDDVIISHLDLDIEKEMSGFHESLRAQQQQQQ